MITNKLVNKRKSLSRLLIFSILYLTFCSFSGIPTVSSTEKEAIKDTVPTNELINTKWNNVTSLVPGMGVLIAQMNNGDNLIIARTDYEKYAKENIKPDDYDKTFTKVEIEPEFRGGYKAWSSYVNKYMQYPKEAVAGEIQGVVVVQFIVDTEGNINEVQAVSGPATGGLREEAVRLVQMSGKWNTAIQNFRLVKAYKKQPVTFRLTQQ